MFRATPRHALGEKAIAAGNQFANVGNPSEGRRESDAEVRTLGNLRERNPWQGHCTDGHKSGPNTMAADLVGPTPNLKCHFLAHVATTSQDTCKSCSQSATTTRSSAYNWLEKRWWADARCQLPNVGSQGVDEQIEK